MVVFLYPEYRQIEKRFHHARFKTEGLPAKEYIENKRIIQEREDSSIDSTTKLLDEAKPVLDSIHELDKYTIDGINYVVDGNNVVHNNSPREREVAKILQEKLGVKVAHVPEIKGIYKGKKTPDYLINGTERWDLKEIKEGHSAELLRNIIHKKKGQAETFVFDITQSDLPFTEIDRQARQAFSYYNTEHAKRIIIIKNDEILRIYDRK